MSRLLPALIRNPVGLLAGLAVLVGGCAPDRAVTGSIYPHDYRVRHPIVLAEGARTLDVFVIGSGVVEGRQRDDVRAFVAEYRRSGQGPIVAQLPVGARTDGFAHRTLDSIRGLMDERGLGPVPLALSSYRVADPGVAAPVRLSFQRLQAKVATKCGQWPQDLGGSDPRVNYGNEPYWNLGCAAQANLAAQVADPVDLVRGRTETHGDTLRHVKDIQDLRDGKDPSTVYRQDNQNRINQSVGN
jgi:pilus assembly protein CpaD